MSTAAHHPCTAIRSSGIPVWGIMIILSIIPIINPFFDIPRHIKNPIKTDTIGITTDPGGVAQAICEGITNIVSKIEVRTARTFISPGINTDVCCPARCFFPLRLGGQTFTLPEIIAFCIIRCKRSAVRHPRYKRHRCCCCRRSTGWYRGCYR
jgi:hypothetical protein